MAEIYSHFWPLALSETRSFTSIRMHCCSQWSNWNDINCRSKWILIWKTVCVLFLNIFYLHINFTSKSFFLICTFYSIHRFVVATNGKRSDVVHLLVRSLYPFWDLYYNNNNQHGIYVYQKYSSLYVICLEIWFSMDESIISFHFNFRRNWSPTQQTKIRLPKVTRQFWRKKTN